MPMYEYECPDCGKVVEEIRKVNDRDNPTQCPECGSFMIKKVSVSSFTIDQFMGTCA